MPVVLLLAAGFVHTRVDLSTFSPLNVNLVLISREMALL